MEIEYEILDIYKELIRLLSPHGILVGWKLESSLIALGIQFPSWRLIDLANDACLIQVLLDQLQLRYGSNCLGIHRPLNLVDTVSILFGSQAAQALRSGPRDPLYDALAIASLWDKFGRQMFDSHFAESHALIRAMVYYGVGRTEFIFDCFAPDASQVPVGPHQVGNADFSETEYLAGPPPLTYECYTAHPIHLSSVTPNGGNTSQVAGSTTYRDATRCDFLLQALWSAPGDIPFIPENYQFELMRIEEFPFEGPVDLAHDLASLSSSIPLFSLAEVADYVFDCRPSRNRAGFMLSRDYCWASGNLDHYAIKMRERERLGIPIT